MKNINVVSPKDKGRLTATFLSIYEYKVYNTIALLLKLHNY